MQKKVFRYEKEKRCTCTLYMTESCNLNCVYCYEHIKGKAIIPLEIAQEAIKSTFKRAVKEQINYVEILFHGGEPFMAFQHIKVICEWLWQQAWPTKYICYATREMHNRNRSNSYDKIDINFFKDNWPDQGVKMTPSPGTLSSLAKGIIYIHELGFKRNNCTFASGVEWDKDEFRQNVDYKKSLLICHPWKV